MEVEIILRVGLKFLNTKWNTRGEGSFPLKIDAETRRCG